MRREGENPNAYKPTRAVVTTGPYTFSRNPMYVSMILVYAGIALIVNTIWPLAFLPVALAALHYGVTRREERYLEKLFGDWYRQYRARVRRWL